MKKFKGTPGTWTSEDGTIFIDKRRTGVFSINSGGIWLADCKPYGGFFPEYETAKANAKLIAAAPELLEIALQSAKDLGIDIDCNEQQFLGYSKYGQLVITTIRKALNEQ